ncbi:Glycosyltransferase, family GT27 [Chondrus crispus]|uniref:Glycosyltransferase, family GT27 n=1 Tax=Chondrus crispus TaxID=2769 RepID=R7QKY6_CHOCR|nr:Glycosyltransferase, family GT27 [Chondrus crispus]CDF39182.1 Glycosyltransferase, family GT27 [Chondrus crispus]|eukprot:XP_005719093.1 Glycosyltransferase, family GT27 [Chondrus crispus]
MVVKRRGRRGDAYSESSEDHFRGASPANSSISFRNNEPKRLTFGRVLTKVLLAMTMVAIGWVGHGTFRSTQSVQTNSPTQGVADPPWWLEQDEDDFFSRTYIEGLSAVRNLSVKDFFTGMCGRYRFDEDNMPNASIVATVQNEQDGMLTLTIHSILARTPPSLLKEIIIVDDNGLGEVRGPVNETELEELKKLDPRITILTNERREGVARCRMRGARAATGDVLVFIDSHIEMLSATWLQHLLVPITENPRTLAAQTLDIINDMDWTYGTGSGDLLYGVITDKFWFGYQRSRFGGPDDNGDEREAPGRRLPYETPFAAGSLFAIRRDEFFRLGGYDEGMYVWGGENTDFAIKVWACGGRLVMVPCSRVGHMYRIHLDEVGRWPPVIPESLTDRLDLARDAPYEVDGHPADNFTKIITRNNIRVLERWAKNSNARTGFYKLMFGAENLPEEWQAFADQMGDDPYAQQQEQYLQKNGCKDFNWFDKHVYFKLTGVHHPWHPESPGRTWV